MFNSFSQGGRGHYNPNEPRDERGRWTSDGSGAHDTDGGPILVADRNDETYLRKERFVAAHLGEAAFWAKQIEVPVENFLGLSALESGWGEKPIATDDKNFFGIHAPAVFSIGARQAKDNPNVWIAQFPSYGASAGSFIQRAGNLIRKISDPTEFARRLQDSGKFGVDKHGHKVPDYVEDVASTIVKLRPFIKSECLRRGYKSCSGN